MRARLYQRTATAATFTAALVLALPTAALASRPCEGRSHGTFRSARPSTEDASKKKRKCHCCHKSRRRHENRPQPRRHENRPQPQAEPRPTGSDYCPDCSGHTPLPEAPAPATNKTPQQLTLAPQAIVAFLPLPDMRPPSTTASPDPAGHMFGSMPLHAQLCVWLN